MDNSQIADIFEEMADLLELKGENPFRIRAYRNGAKAIRDSAESVGDIVASGTRKLTDIDGVGETLAEKTVQLLRDGKLEQLEKLRQEVPRGLLQFMRIPGLGAKKAATLHKELGLETLADLRAACEKQQIRGLKGFGAKTEQAILEGLSIAEAAAQRLRIAEASLLVERLRHHFASIKSIDQIEFAGSFRRSKETVGDLDILVDSTDVEAVMDHFASFSELSDIIARGGTKMSIRVGDSFQVDLRVVPKASFGAALQYFTGSKEHNVIVRQLAKEAGLRVNEYGVYKIDDLDHSIAGASEEDVYKAVGLPWIPPELREARKEFEWARTGTIPKLIELSDLRGDLHMHTTATDGEATLEEMVAAARKRGWEYIAITDHSKRVSMARGLDSERLRQQWKEIDALNKKLDGEFYIFKGIECDILEAGGMDLPDDVLSEADWVLASVHYGQKQPRQQITDRILGAIENPWVNAVAHPTGRLIGHRPAYEVDLEAVFQAAKENKKAVELNANPARLDLNDIHCRMANNLGLPIVINSDAHSTSGFDVLPFGIGQARRAGLSAADVLNTLSLKELKKRLKRK